MSTQPEQTESAEPDKESLKPYRLYKHQEEAVALASAHDSYALFMETGTGKTLVAIEMLQRWLSECGNPALIVCPLSVIEGVWMPELEKFAPNLTACNLWGSWKKGIAKADVYLINYESVSKLPEKFLKSLCAIVLDESSKIKSHKAAVTKFLLASAHLVPHRLIMSGTPAPNSPLEYWSQMKFVDPFVLGPNYYAFRSKYFYSTGFGGYKWLPQRGLEVLLPKMLSKKSFSIKKDDCLDLPDQTFEMRKYIMDPSHEALYKAMVRQNIVQFKSATAIGVNELAKIMKLRQITAGFFIDDSGATTQISTGKLDLLKETLEEIGEEQAIIWCQFHWEIAKIKAMLGENAGVVSGQESPADRQSSIEKFKSKQIKYLIAHPRSAGHGLTLINASYSIYFSLSYSFEEEKQSQDRIHRIGQTKKTTYIYLVASKSIDEKIYGILRKKENMSDAVLEMIRTEVLSD